MGVVLCTVVFSGTHASAQSSVGVTDTSGVLSFRPRTSHASAQSSSGATDSSYVITLERTTCLGSCPAYVVTLTGRGYEQFTYLGRMAPVSGDPLHAGQVRHFRVASGRVARLRRWVDSLGFFDIPEDWTGRGSNCPTAYTDEPTATITVTDQGRRHVVRHYYGCTAAPAVLTLIEARIDSTAEVWRWFDTTR
jgi:hypothetical protein